MKLLLLLTTVAVVNSETLRQVELIDDVSSGMNDIFNSGNKDLDPFGGKLVSDGTISSSGKSSSGRTNNTEEVCRCWDAKFDLNVSTFPSRLLIYSYSLTWSI